MKNDFKNPYIIHFYNNLLVLNIEILCINILTLLVFTSLKSYYHYPKKGQSQRQNNDIYIQVMHALLHILISITTTHHIVTDLDLLLSPTLVL